MSYVYFKKLVIFFLNYSSNKSIVHFFLDGWTWKSGEISIHTNGVLATGSVHARPSAPPSSWLDETKQWLNQKSLGYKRRVYSPIPPSPSISLAHYASAGPWVFVLCTNLFLFLFHLKYKPKLISVFVSIIWNVIKTTFSFCSLSLHSPSFPIAVNNAA